MGRNVGWGVSGGRDVVYVCEDWAVVCLCTCVERLACV